MCHGTCGEAAAQLRSRTSALCFQVLLLPLLLLLAIVRAAVMQGKPLPQADGMRNAAIYSS